MMPRSGDRGNAELPEVPVAVPSASMMPRSGDRGNDPRGGAGREKAGGFNDAAIRGSRKCPSDPEACRRKAGFNDAAIRGSRKFLALLCAAEFLFVASMMPRSGDRGNAAEPAAPAKDAKLQ